MAQRNISPPPGLNAISAVRTSAWVSHRKDPPFTHLPSPPGKHWTGPVRSTNVNGKPRLVQTNPRWQAFMDRCLVLDLEVVNGEIGEVGALWGDKELRISKVSSSKDAVRQLDEFGTGAEFVVGTTSLPMTGFSLKSTCLDRPFSTCRWWTLSIWRASQAPAALSQPGQGLQADRRRGRMIRSLTVV